MAISFFNVVSFNQTQCVWPNRQLHEINMYCELCVSGRIQDRVDTRPDGSDCSAIGSHQSNRSAINSDCTERTRDHDRIPPSNQSSGPMSRRPSGPRILFILFWRQLTFGPILQFVQTVIDGTKEILAVMRQYGGGTSLFLVSAEQ